MNKKGLELMEASYDIYSTFADKVSCICIGQNARLVFLENVPEMDTIKPRVSVTIPFQSLVETATMLNDIIKQVQDQNKTPETPPAAPKEPEKPDEVLH